MKLLIVTNNPARATFRQRIATYLDTLRANDIHCEVAVLPAGLLARRQLLKRAADFDGLFLHKKGLNVFDAFCLRKYARKIIYNFDDAVMYSDKKPDRHSRSHFVPFRRTVRLADMVVVGSEYLAQHARKFNADVKVLPIGLKVSDYMVDSAPKNDDKIRLLWIGSKSTLHYLAQIKPVLENVGSRYNNVILRIVGDEFLDLENMHVEKRVWAVHSRGLDLASSDIGLAPLPDNRFTQGKCSFKVLEYASAGLPVVASPVGTNSVHVRDAVTGFLAADSQAWTDRITQLIEDPQLRRQMGQAGQSHAQNFDVSVIGRKLVDLIRNCLQNPVLLQD